MYDTVVTSGTEEKCNYVESAVFPLLPDLGCEIMIFLYKIVNADISWTSGKACFFWQVIKQMHKNSSLICESPQREKPLKV